VRDGALELNGRNTSAFAASLPVDWLLMPGPSFP
jgi:hypothetical protein